MLLKLSFQYSKIKNISVKKKKMAKVYIWRGGGVKANLEKVYIFELILKASLSLPMKYACKI